MNRRHARLPGTVITRPALPRTIQRTTRIHPLTALAGPLPPRARAGIRADRTPRATHPPIGSSPRHISSVPIPPTAPDVPPRDGHQSGRGTPALARRRLGAAYPPPAGGRSPRRKAPEGRRPDPVSPTTRRQITAIARELLASMPPAFRAAMRQSRCCGTRRRHSS